jgi:hypothetical protein
MPQFLQSLPKTLSKSLQSRKADSTGDQAQAVKYIIDLDAISQLGPYTKPAPRQRTASDLLNALRLLVRANAVNSKAYDLFFVQLANTAVGTIIGTSTIRASTAITRTTN